MKVIDQRHLPEDRPSTMDDKGRRVYLFPATVSGVWRKRRTIVQVFLIFIFLFLPWVKIAGHPAILLDLPNRQFAIFGLTFWAHDTPILFFVFLIAAITLAFITAIWGRIWCGWACPQTVFIDGVFRRIEQWVIGNHREQIDLAKAEFSLFKIYKLSLKWFFFIFTGLVISHSFLAYFVGADNLRIMITSNPIHNWSAFLVMGFTTFLLIFDFAWFREQFCMIMCPYGRFQSILMDRGSLAVLYDKSRGEPRGKKTLIESEASGDCIDCYRCVSVCPTGIDIRRGLQMECIACTACIDACDEVMTKIKKPKGLIRYASYSEFLKKPRKIFTTRLFFYIAVLIIAFTGLIYSVISREPIHIAILRGQDKPYEAVEDNKTTTTILNHFKLHIQNHEFHPVTVKFYLSSNQGNIELLSPINPILLQPGADQKIPFFVRFSADSTKQVGSKKIFLEFSLESMDESVSHIKLKPREVNLLGPF